MINITAEQQVSCFMTAVNMHTSTIQPSDELQGKAEMELITNLSTPASDDGPANDNTSDAMFLIGHQTILAFMTMLVFMTLY